MSRARRRAVLIAVLALVLVAVVVWWLGPPESPGAAQPVAAPTAPPSTNTAPHAEPPAGDEPATRPRPVRLTSATASDDAGAEHGVFAGRVIDWGTGKPVADAEITFERDGAAASVRSSDNGVFEFRPDGAGSYRLAVATADGYLPYAPDWGHSPIVLVARPRIRIDGIIVYLSPAIEYAGAVVDPEDQPIAGARVRLLDARVGERALLPIEAEYTTDAAGEFTFNAPDGALLEATHAEFAPGRARLDDAAQVSHKLKIQLGARGGEAAATGSITGRVVDAAGDPVADAMVRASPWGGLEWGPQAVSGPDGGFALHGLGPVGYTIEASHDDYAPERAAADAGAANVVITLGQGGFVRGRVVTSDGEPVPAFTIAVIERPTALREFVVAHASVFDGSGAFEVGGLRADREHWVRAIAHGYAQSDAFAAEVATARGEADPVDITMRRGGTLIGAVVSADGGRPLESAKVTVEGSMGEGASALPTTATAITDEAGEFELAGLAPGLASVLTAAFEHHPRIVSGLQVADGARLGPITIELTPLAEGEDPKLELAGIGAALSAVDDGLVIQRVFPGGGAGAAGLEPGDVITAVEGMPVLEIGFQDTIQRIRGPVGTQVRLTVRRTDGETSEVVATRFKIRA